LSGLISLKEAKAHLRVTHSDADEDIVAKIEVASALVLDFFKLSAIPDAWYINSPQEINAPDYYKNVTSLVLGELYFNREASISNILSQGMLDLIRLKRDPTVA